MALPRFSFYNHCTPIDPSASAQNQRTSENFCNIFFRHDLDLFLLKKEKFYYIFRAIAYNVFPAKKIYVY